MVQESGNSRDVMGNTGITTEERVGLLVAIVAHAALVAALVFRPVTPPPSTPERIAVTLSDTVGLTSTSPEPAADSAPDLAPTLGEAPAFEPAPEPQPQPEPQPRPSPVAKPDPAPRPKPQVAPSPAPRPTPKATPRAEPAPKPRATTPARTPARSEPRPKSNAPAGGSSFSDAFKEGVPGSQSQGQSRNAPAAGAGPSQASLASAIKRELKPHWVTPQGADAEKLVTFLAWTLNRDGSLAGTPRVIDQQGISDANRAQAARHAEQAIRAVQLAAPFDLPEEYYDSWKRVASFRFDRRLSQ